MYGLVNKAVEGLISSRFGEEVWRRISEQAGVEHTGFVSMDPYPDEITYRLVDAASEVLNTEVAELLEAFGEYWILYTAEEGYGELMELFGRDLDEFLDNLDSMHGRVALSFPELRPPKFRRESLPDGTTHLHYFSEREGLTSMVLGLLRGLGDRFDEPVEVELIETRDGGADHDVIAIRRREA